MKYTLAILSLLVLPAMAFAGVSASLYKAGTHDASASQLPPAQGGAAQIQLDLEMVADVPLGAWDGGIEEMTWAGARGWSFDLTAVALGAPFTAGDWDWASMYGVTQTSPIDPVGNSLGRMKPSLPDYPAGTYTVVTVTIDIPMAAGPGSYTFQLGATSDHGLLDPAERWWNNVDDGTNDYSSLGTFTLTLTPEPATMLLLAGALPFLRRRTA